MLIPVSVLKTEIAGMEERQMPFSDGTARPSTLVSVLRQAFAACVGCHVAEVTAKMWEVLSGTVFDSIDAEMMAMIVNGEPLVNKGMRRIF